MKFDIAGIQTSNSKQYWDWANFLQRHGQIDVLSIDANIKTSWQCDNSEGNFDISGADLETYNTSHIMNDSFMSWKITMTQNHINSIDNIIIKIQKIPKFLLFWNYIKNFPIFSFLLFALLLVIFLVYFGSFGKWLFKIFIIVDVIGMILSIMYFLQRFIRYMFSLLTVNYITYGDVKVIFANKSDISIISNYIVDGLKLLLQDLDVSEILIYKNNIYIKQSNQIYPKDLLGLFDNFFTKKYKSEDYKIDLIKKTYDILIGEKFNTFFIKK